MALFLFGSPAHSFQQACSESLQGNQSLGTKLMTTALTLKEGNEDVNIQRRDRKEKMPQMLMKVIWRPSADDISFSSESDSAFLFCSASKTSDRDLQRVEV